MALQGLQSGESPGIDGLTADFLANIWPLISEDPFMVLKDSLENGLLPHSCRRAVLNILPKKRDLDDIRNWRPVSLLCTDYKILSKVLANRIRLVLEQVYYLDQTFCVPGWLITT